MNGTVRSGFRFIRVHIEGYVSIVYELALQQRAIGYRVPACLQRYSDLTLIGS